MKNLAKQQQQKRNEKVSSTIPLNIKARNPLNQHHEN
jgi:hypothetical protein